MDVGEFFARLGFGGYLAAFCLKPIAEGCHQGRGAGPTSGEALTLAFGLPQRDYFDRISRDDGASISGGWGASARLSFGIDLRGLIARKQRFSPCRLTRAKRAKKSVDPPMSRVTSNTRSTATHINQLVAPFYLTTDILHGLTCPGVVNWRVVECDRHWP
jgi:hypothetical protein